MNSAIRMVCSLSVNDAIVSLFLNSVRFFLGCLASNKLSVLKYRMVFAVASTRTVMIYDTEQMYPIALIKNIHCLSITDLSWSNDGLCLCVSSTDGYCTFIRFLPGELGRVLSGDDRVSYDAHILKSRQKIQAMMDATTSTVSPAATKKKGTDKVCAPFLI